MIFYFSGTGNTRWAAERLAEATQERLLAIPDELRGDCRYTLAKGERIGLCFPIHGWQPPAIVRRFVERLQLPADAERHYVYAVCTCGDNTGLAVTMLSRQLRGKGLHLGSCLSLVMPESYVALPLMHTDTPERERQKTAQAAEDLEHYISIVQRRQTGFRQLVRGAAPWVLSHVVGAFFNRFMITDRPFAVDTNRCLGCGRCQRVCPVGNIQLSHDRPKWNGDSSCTCCLSCYHHCPVHAISYGPVTRRRGQYYFGHRRPAD